MGLDNIEIKLSGAAVVLCHVATDLVPCHHIVLTLTTNHFIEEEQVLSVIG